MYRSKVLNELRGFKWLIFVSSGGHWQCWTLWSLKCIF